MLTKCELMHIGTANNIAMSGKATGFTCPISILRLMFMPTDRTLATCSSFGASEAHDVDLLGYVGQVVDILAIFPQGHALIVVSATIPIADTMGIADEERANFLFLAEGDDFSRGFVSQITNTALSSAFLLILGTLQLFPPSGVFLAPGLLLGYLSKLLGTLPFERPDTTACHDHGLSCVCADCCKMDFTKVYCCMYITGCFFFLRLFDTDMQLETVVPNEATCTAVIFQFDWQNDGFPAFAHWQNHPSVLFAYRLGRPFDWIETLFTPGVFHLHLRMSLTELACGIDVGKKSMDHHLHRLTLQRELPFGGFLQLVATRPLGMSHSCLFVDLTTEVPYFGRFHLSSFQTSKQLWSGLQSIHTHCIHAMILSWIQVVCKWVKPDGHSI
jgi:hypothetical protein